MSGQKKIGLLLVFIWYCMCVFIVTPLLVEYLFTTNTVLTELFAELISVGLPVTFLAIRKNRQKELVYNIYQKGFSVIGYKNIFMSIIVCISFFVGMQYVINVCQIIYLIYTKDYTIISLIPETNVQTMILSILVYAVLPAIYEEIMYRGLYADAFSTDHVFLLYLGSSIVFASSHSNVISIINAFVLGVLLMMIYQRYRSLYLVMILHFINNLLALVFTNYVSLPFSALNVLNDYANEEQMWAAVVVSFGISAFMIVITVLCIITINRQKLNLEETKMLRKNNSQLHRVIDYVIVGLLFLLAAGLIIMKIF